MPIFTESSIRLLSLVKSTLVIYSGDLELTLTPNSTAEFRADSQIVDDIGIEFERKQITLRMGT